MKTVHGNAMHLSQCERELASNMSAQRLSASAKLLVCGTILAIICHAFQSFAATPSADEMRRRSDWLMSHFGSRAATPVFSFAYDGHDADRSLDKWKRATARHAFADRTLHATSFTDPRTGLVVRCEVAEFRDHAAVEWVVYLKNTGSADTPILADIRALDNVILSAGGDAVLHYARGAVCSMDDFAPLTETIKAGTHLHLEPAGGRSSSDFLPFFNLETPSRGGVVIGLGWSGEWAADFIQEGERRSRVQAGMALTHLKLHPGEEIRTPRVALLFYQGDWIRGQNLWRRFLLDQHRPKVNGQPLDPPVFNGNWGGTPAASHLENIKAIVAHDLPVEFYWIDAEWFGRGAWWMNAGDWSVKRDLYPEGFKPISDALHQSGHKLLLWFEPERVCEGTPWFNEHPQWLLEVPQERRVYNWGDKRTFPDWVTSESRRNQIKDGDRLFNLGDPDARQFVTEFFSARITEFGLDCYRHDANIAPLEFWRAADAPDRQGITEIRWVEGLYAFWDELLRRHPGLLIDNCASGGRRIDLETLSRSTPFWRTDFPGDLTGKQCHTYGISPWIPLNSTGGVTLGRDSDYAWRSTVSSTVTFGLFGNGDASQAQPPPADFPFEKAKATLAQYRRLQPYFLGDYYPLTPYTKAADTWLAWQFHRADLGGGVVQAFRRPGSFQESERLKLRGLNSRSRYVVTDLDDTKPQELSGRELIMNGLLLSMPEKPSARIVTYRQAQ
jgi:alpha-galactosidase